MKASEVQVGGVYRVKVGVNVVPVKITQEKWLGEKMAGWVGLNLDTKRAVRIKSAQRLRAAVEGGLPAAAPAAPEPAAQEDAGTVVAAAGSPRPRKPKGGKPAAKPAKEKVAKAPKPPKEKKMSGLDAAAAVLAAAKRPMGCKEIVAEAEKRGLWKSPGGKTPESTCYAAIIREIAAKGRESRFKKVERGLFAAGKGA